MLSLPIDQIIQYANYGFLGIIVLCAIIGFFRGTLKSGYFMVLMIVTLVISWIVLGALTSTLINFDLSFFDITINGIFMETPKQFISEYIINNSPDMAFMLEEGTYAYSLLMGIISTIVRAVGMIAIVILMFTLYYWFYGILWLIFRKPLRRLFGCKKNEKGKFKVGFISRLGGLGIGAIKGLTYTLLIGIILAGFASVGNSLKTAVNGNEEVTVVCVEDTFTVVQLSDEQMEEQPSKNPLEGYEDIFALLNGYYDTIPGKVFGTVRFGENKTSFDEFLFDTMFSVKGKNGSIKIRSELKKLAKVLSSDAVQSVMQEGFDIKKLYLMEKEDLKELVDVLSSFDCIKVVIPVGLEFVAYSDVLKEALGDEYNSIKELLDAEIEELLKIDYCQEIKSLGYVFVDVVGLLGEGMENPKELDYFNFDQATLDEIFNNLGELNILEIVAPIAINYLINSEAIVKAIEKAGFTIEDLGLNADIDFVAELMNLPKIYEKLTALGIKKVEGKVDLTSIDPEAVEGFVETLFDSEIISNAIPVVASTLTNIYLPDEYSDIFTKEELNNVNWENEFSPLLSAVAMLLKTDILTADDKAAALSELDDQTIEQLGTYLSESELVVNNLDQIISELLAKLLSDKVEFYGLDSSKGETWNKTEIVALFKIMKRFSTGLSLELTDNEIELLANDMASSVFIKRNLNSIVNALTESFGFKVANLKEEEWTVNEIYSTFKALNVVTGSTSGSEVSLEDFLKIGGDKLNILLEAKIIKSSLKQIIIDKSKPGSELEILKGVYENGVNELGVTVYSWDDKTTEATFTINNGVISINEIPGTSQYIIYKNNRYFVSTKELSINLNNDEYTYNTNDKFTVKAITETGELRRVFDAIAKLDVNDIKNFNIDLKMVLNNKETLFASYIVSETIIDQIRNLSVDGAGTVSIPDKYREGGNGEWHGENGELYSLLDALDVILNISSSSEPVNVDSLNEKLEFLYISNLSDNLDVVLKSEIISLTIVSKLKELNGRGLNIPDKYINNDNAWMSEYFDGQLVKHNELGKLIKSLNLILKEQDSKLETIDIHATIDNTIKLCRDDSNIKVLLGSEIVSNTIKDAITDNEALNKDNYISVAFENYGKNMNTTSEWYAFDNQGNAIKKELWSLLKGISLIIGDKSFDELQEFNIEMIIKNDEMVPVYNSNCEITSSNMGVMLESKILEEIFARITKEICADGGYLSLVINIPSDVNWCRNDVVGSEEYDLQTFLDSFFLVQEAFGYSNTSDILKSASNLKKLSQAEVEQLATGMVVSRIFRGSIEKMFNAILGADYTLQSLSGKSMKSWDSIKFVQADYEGVSNLAARNKFIQTFNTICAELNK